MSALPSSTNYLRAVIDCRRPSQGALFRDDVRVPARAISPASEQRALVTFLLASQPERVHDAALIGAKHCGDVLDLFATGAEPAGGFLFIVVQVASSLEHDIKFDPVDGVNERSQGLISSMAMSGRRVAARAVAGVSSLFVAERGRHGGESVQGLTSHPYIVSHRNKSRNIALTSQYSAVGVAA